MILDLDHVRGWISSIWLLLYSGGDFLSFDKWSSNFHQHTCHIYGWFSHATKPRFCERSPKGILSISIYEYKGPLRMRPLDRVDPLQRWLGSCPLLIFYGHHGPSFMAITSGFIGNLAAVTFGGCTAASLIQCKCMYMLIFWKSYINGALK